MRFLWIHPKVLHRFRDQLRLHFTLLRERVQCRHHRALRIDRVTAVAARFEQEGAIRVHSYADVRRELVGAA